jgi:Uma2 family endonuclease
MIAQIQENILYSPEDYLEFEVNSQERHEYIAGEIQLMTGGTPNHAKIGLNLGTILNYALKRQPYDIYSADLRIWIPEKRIYTYPDVMVICPPLEYAENRRDTVTNPLLIGEVLSKSTRNYDKSEKFDAYRTIPSFREYLLVEQSTPRVEHYRKTEPNQWILTEYEGLDAVFSLASVPVEIRLVDLYDKVDFEKEV